MYIFQAPVGGLVFFIGKRLFSAQPGGLGVTVVFVLVLVCFSSVVFKILEEPANRFLKRKLTSSSQAALQKSGSSVLRESNQATVLGTPSSQVDQLIDVGLSRETV
jgi:peptidoglycan/LPS O-acetylase OafA/YrhL